MICKETNFAGQYYVLDKNQGEKVHSIIFPCPDEHGFKGVCVTPTVHGNLLVDRTVIMYRMVIM